MTLLMMMRKKRGMNVRMKKVTEYPYNNENDHPNNEKKNENEKQPEDDSNIRT